MENEANVNDIVNAHVAAKETPPEGDTGKESKENKEAGGAAPTEAEIAAAKEKETAAGSEKKEGAIEPDAGVKKLFEKFGVSSEEELAEKLKPKEAAPEETPAQKEKREALYRVDLQRFAVEKGVLKPDDFHRLETLRTTAATDLVFKSFADEVREEIKADNKDFTEEDVEKAIKEQFEKEYPVNSTNEKTKARAMAKIEREAKQMRDPIESSLKSVQEEFDEEQATKKAMPEYMKTVEKIITDSLPEKFNVFKTKDGEADIDVEVDLSPEQKKSISEKVLARVTSEDLFDLYNKKDVKKIQEIVQEEVDRVMWKDHREDALKKVSEKFLELGKTKGSTTGAKNPFPLKGQPEIGDKKIDKVAAKDEVMKNLRGED